MSGGSRAMPGNKITALHEQGVAALHMLVSPPGAGSDVALSGLDSGLN